jgi:molecular chaperone GrpE
MTEKKQPEDSRSPEREERQAEVEQDEMTVIKDQLEEALREKDQFRAMAQRAQADLINYRRRASEEQDEIRRNANTNLLLKILGVVDDFHRALSMIPEDAVAPGWFEGLQLVERNLANILESEGVSKIEARGKPFEPWEHEAVFYQETPGGEEGMVTDVVRDGYRLRDRVLRAAQVVVSRAPESQTDDKSNINEQEA